MGWYAFFPESLEQKSSIRNGLAGAGVQRLSEQGMAMRTPGIVLFDEVSSGLCDFLSSICREGCTGVVAASLRGSVLASEESWALLQAGASDVVDCDQIEHPVEHLATRLERWGKLGALLSSLDSEHGVVGDSPAWRSLLRKVVEVAHFGVTDTPILIHGESGTGKEVVARLIHALTPQMSEIEMVVRDCATLAPELAGSELFGHEKGAFTGANFMREGAFSMADGGTLFLDEIGELGLALQAQLLRVAQEGTYKRLGGNVWYRANFRLICATNRNLLAEISAGRFREDLYHRIAGWTFTLPPLKHRADDILPLTEHFMRMFTRDGSMPRLARAVREYLVCRDYPGNIRDLRQLVSRIMLRYTGSGCVTAGDIPEEDRPKRGPDPAQWLDGNFEVAIRRAILSGVGLKDIGRAAEEIAIRCALTSENGNRQRAADVLGVSRRTIEMRSPGQAEKRPPQ